MALHKLSASKAGWRGNCPDRWCTSHWETLVKKIHIRKFSGANSCLLCLLQPTLCSQKICAGKGFGNDSTGAFAGMCTATWDSPMLPEGNDFPTARDAAQSSLTCYIGTLLGEVVKDIDSSCDPQLYSGHRCRAHSTLSRCASGS